MTIKTLSCPNCGAAFNPESNRCEYCGSYIFVSNENFRDLSGVPIDLPRQSGDGGKYPGVYVFGRLLGVGERPLVLGAANYYTGVVSAGGKLLLTNKSLSFSAHALNIGRKETCIALKDITDVHVCANFLISQHILVTAAGEQHKFVVFHGEDWVRKIRDAAAHCES